MLTSHLYSLMAENTGDGEIIRARTEPYQPGKLLCCRVSHADISLSLHEKRSTTKCCRATSETLFRSASAGSLRGP